MSELDTHRIEVPVESDGVVYVFEGLDAEERHQDWALTGAATFDRIEPRAVTERVGCSQGWTT